VSDLELLEFREREEEKSAESDTLGDEVLPLSSPAPSFMSSVNEQ